MKNYTESEISNHFDSVCEIDRENYCEIMALAHETHRSEMSAAEYAGSYRDVLLARNMADKKLQSAIDSAISHLMDAPVAENCL